MSEKPQVVIPQMCERHRYDFLARRMKIGPDDPRLAIEVTVQLLLFRIVAADPRIVARAAGEADNLSLVLGELGCMACWDQKAYRLAYRCCQKGLEHAALVANGKLADEGFPLPPSSEAA
jgi:predicted TIM-barrel fold metal-dependent hydrolase